MTNASFSIRADNFALQASGVERRLLDWLTHNREAALHASGARIAAAAGTSDATVIRTARKLGYGGLDGLRRALAEELRHELTLTQRMASDVARAQKGSPMAVAAGALRASLSAIEALDPGDLDRVVQALGAARRVHVFGIGPSGDIARYMTTQLIRLGLDARAITHSGLQIADDLVGIAHRDAVIALAYSAPYPEVRALFDRAEDLGVFSLLITSSGTRLPDARAAVTFRVPRGRSEGFGLHAGTLALLEGMLIALSAADPDRAANALGALNDARLSVSRHR